MLELGSNGHVTKLAITEPVHACACSWFPTYAISSALARKCILDGLHRVNMGSHQCPPALQTIKYSVSLCSIELVINLRSGRQRLQLLLGLCHLLGAVAPSRQHRPPLRSGRRAWRTRTTARLGISRSFSQTQTLQTGRCI